MGVYCFCQGLRGFVPDYLFSFGLTTSPKQQYPHTELTSNPDPKPKNGKKSYIQHDYYLTHANAYDSKPLQGWQFDEADLSVVRRLKKKARKAIRKKKIKKMTGGNSLMLSAVDILTNAMGHLQ